MNTYYSQVTPEKADRALLYLVVSGILTIVISFIPYGNYILYPFTILGTWFHEMGHGLTALLLGGHFSHLEIYQDGSGLAYSSTSGGRMVTALVSAGGLMGPPVVGCALIFMGSKPKLAKIAAWAMVFFFVFSILIWIRTIFGVSVLSLFAVVTFFIVSKGSDDVKQFYIQFLGIQACVDTYNQIPYLYVGNANVGGVERLSDTGQIANQLFLPYWVWGTLLLVLSVSMLSFTLYMTYRKRSI